MSWINVLVIGVIAVLLLLDVRYLYRNRGKNNCSGSCSSCGTSPSACKWTQDIQKAKQEITGSR